MCSCSIITKRALCLVACVKLVHCERYQFGIIKAEPCAENSYFLNGFSRKISAYMLQPVTLISWPQLLGLRWSFADGRGDRLALSHVLQEIVSAN